MRNTKYIKNMSISKALIFIILLILSLSCIIPILAIVSISLSHEADIVAQGYNLLPANIDFSAYKFIFEKPKGILTSYAVTIFTTTVGTSLSLLIMSLIAYPLSRPTFAYRNKIAFFVFFTMLFNGGLVPWYMVITRGLNFLPNTIWVMIIPYLANAWNIMLLKSFFATVPDSLIESARIDGSSEIRTFFTIALPLAKPGLATIGTFMALLFWNDWWLPLLYVNKAELQNLQFMLYKILSNAQALAEQLEQSGNMMVDAKDIPTESMRMAMCVLAMGPMLFVFPFFQKHFSKGITIGAVKG